MSENTTPQAEDPTKPAKHNRTMVVTVVLVFLGFVALIALNMK